MKEAQLRGSIAPRILDVRSLRRVHFFSELFDEHAWDMMLVLFVRLASKQVIMEGHLIKKAVYSEAPG